MASSQDKQAEIAFFDGHAAADAYDVFTPATNERIIDAFVRLSGLPTGARVVDLGCGSGVFTDALQRRGYCCTGVDLSSKLIAIARNKFPTIKFIEGDVEQLPFNDGSFDGVLLSGLIHHRPDPVWLRERGLTHSAAWRKIRRLRSKSHEPVHVSLSR